MAHSPEPADARADVSADSALILAALGRLETAVRDERAVLGRLRTSLADMAQAIARAKAVADSETSALLLDEFEHRVDGMIEIVGGPSPPIEAAAPTAIVPPAELAPQADALAEMPAERNQVPTVSDVVSRLGPNVVGTDHETPLAVEIAPPAESDGLDAPSVAMLTAMVEALRDSISANAPDTTPNAPQKTEPAPLEAVTLDLDLPPVEAVAHPPVETATVDEQPAEPEPLIASLVWVQPVAEPTAAAMEPEVAAALATAPDESPDADPAPLEAVALDLPPVETAPVEEPPAEPEPL
ncbi:MAG: hypothetical protein NTV56_25705, partial [Alphaproteobacteria bacterium]|nr:hypothetical protein [Alphaproteobacteria bacterium]